MLPGIYSAANAMESAIRQQELSARNLAHSQIPGYRRLVPWQNENLATPESGLFQSTAQTDVAVDLSPGAVQRTEYPLDLAIQGEGFFVIAGPVQPLYTRNGTFQLSSTGTLVTAEGWPVESVGGGVLQVPPDTPLADIRINARGELLVSGEVRGQLQLVTMEHTHKLQPAGATLFSLPPDEPVLPASGQIVQGARELANLHPVQELVYLMARTRQYEAAQRAMQAQSQTLERRMQQLGEH